jgi:hypothetical protein
MKHFITLIIFCLGFSTMLIGQEFNLGIRAGLNYSRFNGPTISTNGDESFSFSNGFHFGITFDYNFTDLIALKTELLYIQNGSEINYEGDSYYKIRLDDDIPTLIEPGSAEMFLDISNAYMSIPLMISAKVSRKIEVFGGVYANLLVQPTARGTYTFRSDSRPDDIRFTQSLDFNYRTNQWGQGSSPSRPIAILVDGERVVLPKIAGAYYQFDADERGNSFINGLDAGLSFGANYFLNRGFYISGRAQYGLVDVTDQTSDRDIQSVSEDGSLQFRDDSDKHFGIQFSFGFKF